MKFFLYQLKITLRERSAVFWVLFFPIFLSLLFYFSFENIRNQDYFETIRVNYVDTPQTDKEIRFIELLENLEYEKEDANIPLFDLKQVDIDEAKVEMENKSTPYLQFKNEQIIINSYEGSSFEVTILKSVLDEYEFTHQKVAYLMGNINFAALTPEEIEGEIALVQQKVRSKNYVQEAGNKRIDPIDNYFFTIIGMSVMFGANIAFFLVSSLHPRRSNTGVRISASPFPKSKLILASLLVSILVSMVAIFITLFLIGVVYGVTLYNFWYIVLASFIGVILSTMFGFMLSYVFARLKESTVMGIIVFISVFGAFLSGMMSNLVKYYIYAYAKPVFYLNPVNLITDSLFVATTAGYGFISMDRYFLNIAIMGGLSLIFFGVTLISLRRNKYESI